MGGIHSAYEDPAPVGFFELVGGCVGVCGVSEVDEEKGRGLFTREGAQGVD